MDIHKFFDDIINQNKKELINYFHKDAIIRFICTNEEFDVREYIKINCDYPGKWKGEIKRLERINNLIILVGYVYEIDKKEEYYVVSFIELKDDLILKMEEYWSDVIDIPLWRKELNIGKIYNNKGD